MHMSERRIGLARSALLFLSVRAVVLRTPSPSYIVLAILGWSIVNYEAGMLRLCGIKLIYHEAFGRLAQAMADGPSDVNVAPAFLRNQKVIIGSTESGIEPYDQQRKQRHIETQQ